MERGCGVGRPARLALHQSAGPNPLSPQGDAVGKQQRAPAEHDGARGTDAENADGTRMPLNLRCGSSSTVQRATRCGRWISTTRPLPRRTSASSSL